MIEYTLLYIFLSLLGLIAVGVLFILRQIDPTLAEGLQTLAIGCAGCPAAMFYPVAGLTFWEWLQNRGKKDRPYFGRGAATHPLIVLALILPALVGWLLLGSGWLFSALLAGVFWLVIFFAVAAVVSLIDYQRQRET
jgi:hypothetical protein